LIFFLGTVLVPAAFMPHACSQLAHHLLRPAKLLVPVSPSPGILSFFCHPYSGSFKRRRISIQITFRPRPELIRCSTCRALLPTSPCIFFHHSLLFIRAAVGFRSTVWPVLSFQFFQGFAVCFLPAPSLFGSCPRPSFGSDCCVPHRCGLVWDSAVLPRVCSPSSYLIYYLRFFVLI